MLKCGNKKDKGFVEKRRLFWKNTEKGLKE